MIDITFRLNVGKRIHDYRVQNDYTQAEFAEIMDISVNFLSEIENGKKGMSQDTIYKLCRHFNLSADYILFGTIPDAEKENTDKISDLAQKLTSKELGTVMEYLAQLKKMRDLNL